MLTLLLLLLCLSSLCNCRTQYDLATIFQHSADAINSNDLKKNDDALRKFYFSHEKDSSIWLHIMKENPKWLKRSLTHDDLINIEKDLERLYRTYDRCWSMDPGQSQVLCYQDVLNILKDTERDTAWLNLVGDIEPDGRGKYGLAFAGFSVMSAHLVLIAGNLTPKIEDVKKRKVIKEGFKSLLNKYLTRFMKYEDCITLWRLDLVTPVKICEVKQLFWRDFEKSCETRWRRNIDNDEEWYNDTADNSGISKLTQTRSNVEKDDSALVFHNNAPSLDVADQIGSSISPNHKRLHATVTDLATGKTIFNKYLDATVGSVGQIQQKLFKEGIRKRSDATKEIKTDLIQFHNTTITVTREILKICLHQLDN